jgi:hypothetical protein
MMARMPDDDRDPWRAEAEAMELEDGDFDVADAAELPNELGHHAVAAECDEEFDDEWLYWHYELLNEPIAMLALEQSCSEGILLPWDMRGARLCTAPHEAMAAVHRFWDQCPKHVNVQLAYFTYWLVRCERARRRGRPEWSPAHPLPPQVPERAFFRPPVLTIRRYG